MHLNSIIVYRLCKGHHTCLWWRPEFTVKIFPDVCNTHSATLTGVQFLKSLYLQIEKKIYNRSNISIILSSQELLCQ